MLPFPILAFAQHVARADFAQFRARRGIGPERLDGTEIDLVAKIVLGFPLSLFLVFHELERGGEAGAGLGRNETVERTDDAFLDQLAYFGLFHFAAANDLVDHKLTIL